MKVGVVSLSALLVLALVASCADSKEVNAAFLRTRVTWAVFDPTAPDGLKPLAGFEQPLKALWTPQPSAVRATDLLAVGPVGAVAVSHLGLLVLDDSGPLTALRPQAQWDLSAYRTDKLFAWQGKVLLTLAQDLPATAPPASLVWWTSGQSRVAFYPVPSQIRNPSRQAVAVGQTDASTLAFTWKWPTDEGWQLSASTLALATGEEAEAAPISEPTQELPIAYAAVRARLAERLGAGVPVRPASGSGSLLVFSELGWVSVGRPGEGQARLYRLPELGTTGRYTGALALGRGWVFTWETAYRGYVGAAGLVYVPFAVLAP